MTDNKEEVSNAPSTEISSNIFVTFDKKQLFAKRENDTTTPFKLKNVHVLEESNFLVTYLSNIRGLTRYDLAYLLKNGSVASLDNVGVELFGEDWVHLFKDKTSGISKIPTPLAWGVQFNWSNHQRRVYGAGIPPHVIRRTFSETMIEIDKNFDEIQQYAERTVSVTSGLMLLNGLMQATMERNKPVKPTTAKKRGN